MNQYILFLALALCNGAIAMTLTKSGFFKIPRNWIVDNAADFIGELVQCPYCVSHWLAMFAVWMWRPQFTNCGHPFLDLVVSTFALVALSSFVAGAIFKIYSATHVEPQD